MDDTVARHRPFHILLLSLFVPAVTRPGRLPPIPPNALEPLAQLERWHVRIARRMNEEPFKSFWTWCQAHVGANWIAFFSSRHTHVYGLEHVEAASHERPILLVANHRSYFDLFLVSSILFRRTHWKKQLFFPVRGRYYYQTVGGIALNLFGGFWSMFPPLFALPTHQAYDRYALDVLVNLCREGRGRILGIHPEGGRNTDPDPYSFRKLQPGAGRIIHAGRPQVIPVFIGGLGNSILELMASRWRGGTTIRIHFGTVLDLDDFHARPAKGSTYKAIVEHVMEHVRLLGEEDRLLHAAPADGAATRPVS